MFNLRFILAGFGMVGFVGLMPALALAGTPGASADGSAGRQVLEFLNTPVARGLVLAIFLTSLYAAMHVPGHGLAETLAVICLSILIAVPLLTGYAQWWEIAAILIGVALLALEIFIIPGFGVVGVAGMLIAIVGFLFTFVSPDPALNGPESRSMWDGLVRGLTTIIASIVSSGLLCVWLRRYLPRMRMFKGLVLTTSVGTSESAMVGSLSNIDPANLHPAVGAVGTAVTDLKPGGSAEFLDLAGGAHSIAVISEAGYVARGTRLVVREASSSRVVVRPAAGG